MTGPLAGYNDCFCSSHLKASVKMIDAGDGKKNCSGIDLNMDSKNENVINWLNSLFLQ